MIVAMLIFSTNRLWSVTRKFLGMLGFIYIQHPMLALASSMSVDKPAPYEQCGYCHEYSGNPPMGNYPKIAGQKREYIIKQLSDYKNGRREGRDMMETAASLLSRQDMQVVATFYSKQARSLDPETAVKTTDYSHARELCKNGDKTREIIACDACHLSDDPRIPYLRGQHAEYLASQLEAFKHKTRTNDVATIMQFLAARLSQQEITQLSEYFAAGEPKP